MRSEERDDLEGSEASGILETLENLGDAVLRLRNETLDGSDGLVGATSQKLELRSTLKNSGVAISERLLPRSTEALTGQLLSATAPAYCTMSPALMVGCLAMKGIRLLTLSSIPSFAWKFGSTVGKRSIDPSAPPPL